MKKLKKLATSLPKDAKLSNDATSKIKGGNNWNNIGPQGADKRAAF